MRHAIRIAFVRRHLRANCSDLPPVRSLAYYRTVAASLTPDERTPEYAAYVDQIFEQLQSHAARTASNLRLENRAQ